MVLPCDTGNVLPCHFVANVSLLSPSLAFILVFSTLFHSPPPCRAAVGYMHDPCIAIWSTLGTATVIC